MSRYRKKKALKKEFRVEVKKSLNRFLSIFFIVAMGVAFFTGIHAAAPDMRATGDYYYDENRLMDLRVIGTLGLTEDDLAALREIEGIETAEGCYMEDVYSGDASERKVLHLESIPEQFNMLVVEKGELPDQTGECFLDSGYAAANDIEVGDILEITVESEEDSMLRSREYSVTGYGYSPAYISFERGTTTLGTGEVSGFAYVVPEEFDVPVYSVAYMAVLGAREEMTYTDAYEQIVEEVYDRIDRISGLRCEIRYQEVMEEAQEALDEGKQEVEDGKKELEDAKQELAEAESEAEQELAEAESELIEGESELEKGRQELLDAKQEMEEGESELAEGESELAKQEETLADAKEQMADGISQLNSGEAEYQKGLSEYQKSVGPATKQLDSAQEQIDDGRKQLEKGWIDYYAGLSEIEAGEAQLAKAELQLSDAQAQYDAAYEGTKAELDAGLSQYNDGIAQLALGKQEYENGTAALNGKQAEFDQGRSELDAAWETYQAGTAQLADAQAQYETAKAQSDQLKQAADAAETALNLAQQEYDTAAAAESAAAGEYAAARATADAARQECEAALLSVTAAQQEYDAAAAAVAAAQQEYDAATAAVAAAQQEYDNAAAGSEESSNGILEEKKQALDAAQTVQAEKQSSLDAAKIVQAEKQSSLDAVNIVLSDKQNVQNVADTVLAEKQTICSDADVLLLQKQEALSSAQTAYAANKAAYDEVSAGLSEQKTMLDTTAVTLAETKKKLEEQETVMAAAKAELDTGWTMLAQSKAQLDAYDQQLTAVKAELDAGYTALTNAKTELDAGWTQIAQQKTELENGKKALEEGKKTLVSNVDTLNTSQKTVEDGRKELSDAQQQLTSARSELDLGWAELHASQEQLSDGERQISDAKKEIADARTELLDARKQIADAEAEIAENEQKLADGWIELEEGRLEAEQEIADAKQKIADAEQDILDAEQEIADAQAEIDDIRKPKWYIDDRSVLPEHAGFGENAERMSSLARVFPVLFFLVAALISLTTMTRMVEEERTQIGTMKALGYSKADIAGKYLKYAFYATIGGSIFGTLFGEKVFPWVIITAYGIIYVHIPKILLPYNLEFALMATGAALLCTIGATMSACRKALREVPAQLMRPPAPKEGKRVLLEYLPFIWKPLKFSWKSTIRNLMRYKKRFLMTVIGIGGCMGLLLVGFGLRDSIMGISRLQFQEVQTYSAMVIVDTDAGSQEQQEVYEMAERTPEITEYGRYYMQLEEIKTGEKTGKEWSAYIYVPENMENLYKFFHFRKRGTEETYELTDDGAILTEKIAKELGIQAGDTVFLEREDGETVSVPITAVCENYLAHYIYMTPVLYEQAFGEKPDYNCMFYRSDADTETVKAVGGKLLGQDAVLNITYTSDLEEQLSSMLTALDMVMVVLIVAAGLLAFVVLYNLNNININERRRELATLKVLGFFDGEVAAYVYRENVLLTVIGAALGCVMGKLLHLFVITTVEVDSTMFGRNINPESFVIGTLFTILFSCIVNFVMYFKLKKIDMVESLKSIE